MHNLRHTAVQADDQRQGVAGAGSRRESATHSTQEDARGAINPGLQAGCIMIMQVERETPE